MGLHHIKIPLLGIALSLGVSTLSMAFPVVIDAQEVPKFIQSPRNFLAAYSMDAEGKPRRIPLQIEEVENGASLIFRNPTGSPDKFEERRKLSPPKKNDPFKGKLYGTLKGSESIHRLILNDKDFTLCDKECRSKALAAAAIVCGSKSSPPHLVSKIDLHVKKTSAFLVNCNKELPSLPLSKVRVDLTKREFISDLYKYKYIGADNLMLDSLWAGKEEVFKQNDLLIHLLPVKFIIPNVSFSQRSITSKITSFTRSPLSLGVEFAMSAKLLGFLKLPNQICCDISFYQDAFYLPVMLNLPSKGSEFKVGSSLIYGLNYQGDINKDIAFHLPKLSPSGKAKLPTPRSPESSALVIQKGNRVIAVGFGNTKKGQPLPAYVWKEDLEKFKLNEKMNSKIGIYYDITSMNKGDQIFKFWFYFGEKEEANTLLEYAKNGLEFTIDDL